MKCLEYYYCLISNGCYYYLYFLFPPLLFLCTSSSSHYRNPSANSTENGDVRDSTGGPTAGMGGEGADVKEMYRWGL